MTSHLSAAERQRLTQLPLIAPLDPVDREHLLDATHIRSWRKGDRVVEEGEPSRALYIVLDGVARVTARAGDREVYLAELGTGAIFGE